MKRITNVCKLLLFLGAVFSGVACSVEKSTKNDKLNPLLVPLSEESYYWPGRIEALTALARKNSVEKIFFRVRDGDKDRSVCTRSRGVLVDARDDTYFVLIVGGGEIVLLGNNSRIDLHLISTDGTLLDTIKCSISMRHGGHLKEELTKTPTEKRTNLIVRYAPGNLTADQVPFVEQSPKEYVYDVVHGGKTYRISSKPPTDDDERGLGVLRLGIENKKFVVLFPTLDPKIEVKKDIVPPIPPHPASGVEPQGATDERRE
jgi:hypothetical protein